MGTVSEINLDSKLEKLTAKQIIEVLELKGVSPEDFGHDNYDEEELGLGKMEEVHNEREGSDFDCIVKVVYFKDHDVYISVSGYYSSQEGSTFDGDFAEVKPEEKTITVYNKVK
jgi:hypothetical protein